MEYPPWIAAYLAHAVGNDAARLVPVGHATRCPKHDSVGQRRENTCDRIGYWFLEHEGTRHDGTTYRLFAVVWDGPTPYSGSAVDVLGCNPGLPYGLDLGVSERHLRGYFSCGWCGKPAARRPAPARPRARIALPTRPPEPPEPRAPVDEARRDEIARWAEKLEKVNPAMAAKVRTLVDLPPPRSAK